MHVLFSCATCEEETLYHLHPLHPQAMEAILEIAFKGIQYLNEHKNHDVYFNPTGIVLDAWDGVTRSSKIDD
jgi:hypothetical protein